MKIVDRKDIALEEIIIGDRIRGVSNNLASSLAKDMDDNGQYQAISVITDNKSGKYLVVDGAHRVTAARQLNWGSIRAEIAVHSRKKLLELAEKIEFLDQENQLSQKHIKFLQGANFLPPLEASSVSADGLIVHESAYSSETIARAAIGMLTESEMNLARVGDTLLSKAFLLWHGKRAYEILYPETSAGGKRNRRDDQSNGKLCHLTEDEGIKSLDAEKNEKKPRYTAVIASIQGVSERSLRDYLKIAQDLGEEHCRMILEAGLPLADHGSHLKELAGVAVHIRQRVIELLIARESMDFKDALISVNQSERIDVTETAEQVALKREKEQVKKIAQISNAFHDSLDLTGRVELMRRMLESKSTKLYKALEANGYRLEKIEQRKDVESRGFEAE